MTANTKIEWTDRTWNPTRGCSVVSEGCHNCYAMKQAHRFSGPGKPYEGLTKQTKGGPQWTGKVIMAPENTLMAPYRWREPQRIFVNSMSDLFHESLTNEQIAEVFHVMYGEASTVALPAHTFQVLTKRAARMEAWFKWLAEYNGDEPWLLALALYLRLQGPHPRVWLGVSAENQEQADKRIPHLLRTPAAVRFVSAEPLLGPIDFERVTCRSCQKSFKDEPRPGLPQVCPHCGVKDGDEPGELHQRWLYRVYRDRLDWIIAGGESGRDARPCDIKWIGSIVDQCRQSGVALFVKQLGREPYVSPDGGEANVPVKWGARTDIDLYELDADKSKGGNPIEWPQHLRVREFPA